MKPNPSLTPTPSNDPHGSGSFAAGFLLGVVTGAVGLWTTQNEQGKDLLNALKEELFETIEAEKKMPAPAAPSSTPSTSKAGKKFPKFSASRSRRS
jgi:nitrogen fixation-related uncharacterized protein